MRLDKWKVNRGLEFYRERVRYEGTELLFFFKEITTFNKTLKKKKEDNGSEGVILKLKKIDGE